MGAALALLLTLSACGTGSDSATPSVGAGSEASTSDGGGSDSGGSDSAGSDEGGSDSASGEGDAEAADDHLFPSVEVLDVATGDPLNLAEELSGGDTPVLLWFWAPH